MKYTLFNTLTLEILGIGECADDQYAYQSDATKSTIIGHYPPDRYYLDINNTPVEKEPPPDDNSEWDAIDKKWKFNKIEAKQRLKKRIERERSRRDLAEIIYDGKNVQADEEARGNIHGKLAEIAAAQALEQTTSPLIWRDADNIDHTWTDMLIYKSWLQGLVMAIAERSTALYQASWAHKSALQALDTVADIKNYDITTGW